MTAAKFGWILVAAIASREARAAAPAFDLTDERGNGGGAVVYRDERGLMTSAEVLDHVDFHENGVVKVLLLAADADMINSDGVLKHYAAGNTLTFDEQGRVIGP